MRIGFIAVVACAALTGCMEAQSTTVATSTQPTATVAATTSQSSFAGLLNQQRAASGFAPVSENARLSQSAQRHAADMAANGYFSHQGRNGSSFSDRANASGYGCARAENIYVGTTNAAQVMAAWMESSGHRRNILLRDVREFGVGQASGYWVLVMGSGC